MTWEMPSIIHHQGDTNQNPLWHHLTCVRMAIIQKMRNSKRWWGCGAKGTLVHSWWGCRLVQPLEYGVSSKKKKTALPYNPTIPLWYASKENENTISERYMHSHVYSSIICNSQIILGSIDREIVFYVYNEILFSHKRRTSCHLWPHGWTLKHYAEWNKSDRQRQIPYDLTYIWKRLVVARGEG